MSLVDLAVLEGHLHLCGELEQPEVVGDGGAVLADLLRESVLRQVVLLDEVLVGQGYFDGVEVLALNVLDEGHLHHVFVVGRAHVGGYGGESGHL